MGVIGNLLYGEQDTEWMFAASCASVPPDMFYPEGKGAPTTDAKRVCRSCPVRAQCLAYAIARDERHGVWGGKSPNERAGLVRGVA